MMAFLFRYGTGLFILGMILGIFFKNPLVLWLCFLGGTVVMVGDILNNATHKLVCCKECGHTTGYQAGKYCTECGGIMEFEKRRIIHQYKICKNGHRIRIRDEHNQYKFCPKCGKPLQPYNFNPTIEIN